MHSSAQGGSFDGSPKLGLDSPNVKAKAKRLKPPVSSLTKFGVIVRRQLADRFRPMRVTSPSGGKPGKTAGRPLRKSPCFVSKRLCSQRPKIWLFSLKVWSIRPMKWGPVNLVGAFHRNAPVFNPSPPAGKPLGKGSLLIKAMVAGSAP